MFEIVDFIYNDEERKVLVDVTDAGNGDIYGFDLNLLSETERDIVFEALEVIERNSKTIYRHFKKDKMQTKGDVKNPEIKAEEKPKRFSV